MNYIESKTKKQYQKIKEFISNWSWGTKKHFRRYTNSFMNCHLAAPEKFHIQEIPNYLFNEHFNNENTIYVSGSGRGKIKIQGKWVKRTIHESIVGIDIDCHKKGTKRGALELASFLKNNYFPELYYETSTNGNGVHAYLIINRTLLNDASYNLLLKKFDVWLKLLQNINNFDIEMVEIKGHCPELEFNDEFNCYEVNKAGILIKCPRSLDFLNTQKITTNNLDILISNQLEIPKSFYLEKPKLKIKNCGSNWGGSCITEDNILKVIPYANKLIPTPITVNEKNNILATADDMAITMCCIYFCTNNMNADGTLPTNRIKSLWDNAFNNNITQRAFDAKRYKYCRDLLSIEGLLLWEDTSYSLGIANYKGIACKWKGNEEFKEIISSLYYTDNSESFFEGGYKNIEKKLANKRGELQIPVRIIPLNPIYYPNLDEQIDFIIRKAA